MSLTVDTDQATYTWNIEDCFVVRHQHGVGCMALNSDQTQDLHGAAAFIDHWVSLMGERKRIYLGKAEGSING